MFVSRPFLALSSSSPVVVGRLLTGLFTVGIDISTAALAERCYGPRAYRRALYFSLSSWALATMGSHTLSDVPESMLCTLAMHYAVVSTTPPLRGTRHLWMALVLFNIAFAIRPSAVIVAVPCVAWMIMHHKRAAFRVICTSVALCLLGVIILDSYFYGPPYPTISFARFAAFNVLSGSASALFGSWPWWWTSFAMFWMGSAASIWLVVGMLEQILVPSSSKSAAQGVAMVFFTALLLSSFVAHKEMRHLLPLLPLLHVLATRPIRRRCHWFFMVAAVIIQAAVAVYFLLMQERGALAAFAWMRTACTNMRVVAATPCYYVPGLAMLHGANISLHVIPCGPAALDYAALMHNDSSTFLEAVMANACGAGDLQWQCVDAIVINDEIAAKAWRILSHQGFSLVASFADMPAIRLMYVVGMHGFAAALTPLQGANVQVFVRR